MVPDIAAQEGRPPNDVLAYIDSVSDDRRALFRRLQSLILDRYPDAETVISYGVPTYKVKTGRVHLGYWKGGVSLYTSSQNFAEFKSKHPHFQTSKGTLRFRIGDEVPIADLVRVIRNSMEFPRTPTVQGPLKRLSPEAFELARRFLRERARPLERTLFQYRFEGHSTEEVLAELARFQNHDGGFGWGLEPDLRTPSSSALATGIGLRTLSELGCTADQPMVRRAVGYLVDRYDSEPRVWRVVPADADLYPHAPWWDNRKETLARTFDGYRIIPRALLLSLLHHYASLVSADWLEEVTRDTVQYIEAVEVLGSGGGSDLEYAARLAQEPNLPERYASKLKSRVRKAISQVTVRDPAQWRTYCITPLRAVPSPRSLGADLLEKELQAHLDYQIAHQAPGGNWEPAWSWGESYPEVWTQARLEWCGILTLETLVQLDVFARIENREDR